MATQNLNHSLSNSSTLPLSAAADPPPSPSKPHPNNHRKSRSKRCVLIILAVSVLTIVLFFLIFSLLFYSRNHNRLGSSPHSSKPPPEPDTRPYSPPVAQIQKACKATRFPDSCVDSLSRSGRVPPDPTPLQIVQSAVNLSSENLQTVQSMIRSILDSSAGNQNRTDVANTCLQILSLAEYRTISAEEALTRGKIKDARSWMSASLAYQYGCWSGLRTVNDTKPVVDTVSSLETLNGFSITTLSMMASYDNFGNDVESWVPPATERDGFWGKTGSDTGLVSSEPKLGFPSDLTEDATVCKDGDDGCYLTVQEAVNSAPNNSTSRFVIRIKKGVYEETVRVPFEKKNVVFIGDGRGKTVITGSLNVGQPGMSTYNSATVGVLGDGFMARDITIENTAGANAHQAVAFRSDSDFSLLENCELLGNQDTLYAHSLRQFYKSCRIVGNVDFIFGNSAAVFHDCEILIAPRVLDPENSATNPIVAQGRTDPSQTTGFVFSNCTVNGTKDYLKVYRRNPELHKSYLGRPWKEFSRTVFLRCDLDAVVDPEGWMPWSGDFALKTLFFGEYKNAGLGYDASRRVPWSSQIPDARSEAYSVENFIQADEWAVQSV